MEFLRNLLSVIFPQVCEVCGRALVDGEKHLCLQCMASMPRLHYHTSPENPFVRRMAAAKIDRVAVMFPYVKGNEYASLIQKAKYNHRPEIDEYLAECFAHQLGADYFRGIDMVMAVPMHWRKRLTRGFNQTDYIARAISKITGIPVGRNLIAVRGHTSQTRKGAIGRLLNTRFIFDVVDAELLCGKHILLVDDVITTGATILACADTLRKFAQTVNISILALTKARQS